MKAQVHSRWDPRSTTGPPGHISGLSLCIRKGRSLSRYLLVPLCAGTATVLAVRTELVARPSPRMLAGDP